MRNHRRKRKIDDILEEVKIKFQSSQQEEGHQDDEHGMKNKKREKTVKNKVLELFEDLENCGGEIDELLLNESKRKNASKKDKTATKLCLVYTKLGTCPKGESCKDAHSIDQLSVPYKPREWIESFKGKNKPQSGVCRELQSAGYNNINKVVDAQGKTLLIDAVISNNIEVAKYIVSQGGDPTQRDWKGYDAISYSLKNSNIHMLQMLIEYSVNKIDLDAYIPKLRGSYLIYATKTGNSEIVSLLIWLGASTKTLDYRNRNAVFYAVANNNPICLTLLLGAGSEVNIYDIDKVDPLQLAFEGNQIEMVKQLVENGAAVNTRARRGRKLIFYAADYNDFTLIRILQERGVSLEDSDDEGRTLVMRAYLAKNYELCKKMLNTCNLRVKINDQDNNGETLLMLVVRDYNHYFLTFIINNYPSIDLERKDKKGRTATILACQLGHDEIVDELIKAGANLEACDENKQNALQAATKTQNIIIVKRLLQEDLSRIISWKDKFGNSAYDYAKSNELKNEIYVYMKNNLDLIDPEVEKGRG